MIENQPVAFTIILIVVVNTLVAVTSGWAFLAFRSPALKDICGTKHWFTSVGTWVYYKRCVKATVGEEGIRFFCWLIPFLYPNIPFLLRWEDIKEIEQREKKLLSYEMTLRMKNGKALALSGSATDRILEMSQNNKHISGSQGH
ncbi:MAG: hypothetical protein ACKVGW_04880 [Verrucomicrobiia bacterium]|jgi:hypothetical protein